MSPVSINDSLVAIRGWGDDATACAQALDRISRKAGALGKEVKDYADTVRKFGRTITESQRTMRDHYVSDNTSATINKLKNASVLDSLASQCEWVMKGAEKLNKRVHDKARTSNLIKQNVWFWDQVKRRYICLSMKRIQKSFQIITSQITYEALQRRALNPSPQERALCDFSKEMRDCRNDIRSYIRAMNILKDEQERMHHRKSHTFNQDRRRRINGVEDTILDIWDSFPRDASKRESSIESCESPSGASTNGYIFEPRGPLSGDREGNRAERQDFPPGYTAAPRDPTMYWPPEPHPRAEFPGYILSQPVYPEPVQPQRDPFPVVAELAASELEYWRLDRQDAPDRGRGTPGSRRL